MCLHDSRSSVTDAGFSLVEALVALAIISLLSLLLGTMNSSTMMIFGRGKSRIATGNDIVRAQSLLVDLLSRAGQAGSSDSARSEIGENKIIWFGTEAAFHENTGTYRYTLQVIAPPNSASQVDGYSLHLQWRQLADRGNRGSQLIAGGLPSIFIEQEKSVSNHRASNASQERIQGVWLRGCGVKKQSNLYCPWPDLYVPFRLAP